MTACDLVNAVALVAGVLWLAPGIVAAKAFVGYSVARLACRPRY